MSSFHHMTVEEVVNHPIPIDFYLEVGLSTSPHIRKFMQSCGARIARLYLGNIFNIDVETPLFFKNMNFSHHVGGNMDTLLCSPHYAHYAQYMCALEHMELTAAQPTPYIWDPCFLTKWGSSVLSWAPPTSNAVPTFIIMEPNISYQKNALLPLLILEKWAIENAIESANIIVINGTRLKESPYYCQLIKQLEISRRGFIQHLGRKSVRNVMTKWPSATVLLHHKDNELNYMTLEFLYAGFPVIHNAASWRDAGYYYTGDSICQGVTGIQDAAGHADRLTVYRSQAQQIFWKHSIHNPTVQQGWYTIFDKSRNSPKLETSQKN